MYLYKRTTVIVMETQMFIIQLYGSSQLYTAF